MLGQDLSAADKINAFNVDLDPREKRIREIAKKAHVHFVRNKIVIENFC